MTNEIKHNEKHPEIKFSFSNIADTRDAGFLWLGNKLATASKHKALTHGPLAAITLPMAIALRETGDALIEVANAGIPSIVCSTAGAISIPFLALFLEMAGVVHLSHGSGALAEALEYMAIGGAVGVIAVPAAAAVIYSACKITKQSPSIIANSVTGFKRSCDFIFGRKAEPAPVVINPVPDRGVEPLTLPAPSALIKLAGTGNKAFAAQNKISAEKEALISQHHEKGPTP